MSLDNAFISGLMLDAFFFPFDSGEILRGSPQLCFTLEGVQCYIFAMVV